MNPGLEPRASELEFGTCKLSNLVTALYICTVQINEQGQVIQISIFSHIRVHLLVLCSLSLRGRYTFRSNTQHNKVLTYGRYIRLNNKRRCFS